MTEEGKKAIKGVKIYNLNIIVLTICIILYAILVATTVNVSIKYHSMVQAMKEYVYCEEKALFLKDTSDYLTEQVRLYVVSSDIKYSDEFFRKLESVQQMRQAMDYLRERNISDEAYTHIMTAKEISDKLIQREVYAISLVAHSRGHSLGQYMNDEYEMRLSEEDKKLGTEEMLDKATRLVFNEEYQGEKVRIRENLRLFLENIQSETLFCQQESVEKMKQIVLNQHILVGLLLGVNVMVFGMVIMLVIRPLRIYARNIREEKMLDVTGSYELNYLAMTYNHIFEVNNASKAMLSHQADHDPLTGIINRGAFNRLVEIHKEDPNPLALLMIDVDKFKQVNDGYGHQVGDRILQKVANLLSENFRSTDFPARIGGDEFSVIVTDFSEDMKSVILDKVGMINGILQNPDDGLPVVSLSVGAAFSEHGFTDELYKNADIALYEVKEHGRCSCRFYERKPQELQECQGIGIEGERKIESQEEA